MNNPTSLLSRLKGVLVNIDVKFPKSIDNNKFEINIGPRKSNQTVVFNGPVLLVNTDTPEGKRAAQQIFDGQDQLLEKGDRTIESETAELIRSARGSALDLAADEGLLQSLKEIVPRRDIGIIHAALFVRRVYHAGGDVQPYKELIMQRYGSRGINICNLVSANYYEDYIIPQYEKLLATEGQFARAIFEDIYEEAVTLYPFAVFVAQSKEYEILKEEIVRKISSNRSVGQHSLNIHGIGYKNSKTIKKLLEDADIRRLCLAKPDQMNLGNTFYARIYF